MSDLCPLCGKDRGLVGYRHLCVVVTKPVTKPISVVTKPIDVTKPKGGRPRLGEEAMSAAERMRRMRARRRDDRGEG